METLYNELLEEFRIDDQSREQLIDFKALHDDLMSHMHIKRQTVKKRMLELRKIRKLNQQFKAPVLHQTACDFSFLTSSMNASIIQEHKKDHSDKTAMIEIQKKAFENQIARLEQEICVVKEEKDEVSLQLQLLDNQEKRIVTAGQESQRLVNEIHRELAQFIASVSEGQDKQHECLLKLAQKKNSIKLEVDQLIRQYQKSKTSKKQLKRTICLEEKDVRMQQEQKRQKPPCYQKLTFQYNLRVFYLVKQMQKCWNREEEFSLARETDSLLTQAEIRLLNKVGIAEYYEAKGVKIDENLARNISEFYQKLANNFDRMERANNQINESYINLSQTEENINASIQLIFQDKQKNTIKSLAKKEMILKQISERLNNACKLIFQFNTRFHCLVKKITNFNKTFDKIIKSDQSSRRLYRKTFVDVNKLFLHNFQSLLEKNPQDALIQWNKILGCSDSAAKHIQMVIKNDLFRVHALPETYCADKSDLENRQSTFDQVFNYEDELIEMLFKMLKGLLAVSTDGIKHLKRYKQKSSLLRTQGFEALQQTFQTLQGAVCVESKDYFRRDNYKLLQKLQKQELKRRGLLHSSPFNYPNDSQINIQEIRSRRNIADFKSLSSQRQLSSSHKKQKFKYNALATRREANGLRQKSLRKLFENLSNITSTNHKYRIQRKTHFTTQDNSLGYSSFNSTENSRINNHF